MEKINAHDQTMRFDIHVHTTFSPCSSLDAFDIITSAKTRGLDGVCLTDHGTMAVRQLIEEGIQDNGLCVIIGMEYTTDDGDFLLFGDFETIEPGLSAEAVLAFVRKHKGVAVAAHPFRDTAPVREAVFHKGFCHIVESINGRNSESENTKIDTWVKHYGLSECGGSDAHTLEELGAIATRISVPVRSRSDFIAALSSGLCRPERIQQPCGYGVLCK